MLKRQCPNCTNEESIGAFLECPKCGAIYDKEEEICPECELETIKAFQCFKCTEVFYKNDAVIFGMKIA